MVERKRAEDPPRLVNVANSTGGIESSHKKRCKQRHTSTCIIGFYILPARRFRQL